MVQSLGSVVLRVACCMGIFAFSCIAQTPTAAKVLEAVYAKYASLSSYSDTGEVVNEFGTNSKETHRFITLFSRSPRGYLLDFTKQTGERYVIWGDPEAFHNWWNAINSKTDYPNPDNLGAFTGADVHTLGVAMKVTTLLYPKANFQGSFTNLKDVVANGTEEISGLKCYKLDGVARDIYGATGRESNVRKMTIWVDVDSMFIRKVVEIPKDILPGHIDRLTTIYDPQANPTLDAGRFRFTPPK